LRLALPFRLDHVNVYLVEDGAGWAVIDTGIDDATTRAAWEAPSSASRANIFLFNVEGLLNEATGDRATLTTGACVRASVQWLFTNGTPGAVLAPCALDLRCHRCASRSPALRCLLRTALACPD